MSGPSWLAPITEVPNSSAPAGIYLHVPFCRRVCPYCDFAVLADDPSLHDRFVRALEREIEEVAPSFAGRDFDSIYFGGGTPSALEPRLLRRLLNALHSNFDGAPGAVIHFEANPEDVTEDRAASWRHLGVEFVSLGAQSLDDAALKQLGRRHRSHEAIDAVRILREHRFGTVNIDAMFGRPGQSVDDWRDELERIADLQSDHISGYQLTIHSRTPFSRALDLGVFEELGDDEKLAHFRTTREVLARRGFEAYEVSNFAKSTEHRSRHNPKYWDHRAYIGLGPSAHSHLDGRRWANHSDLGGYLSALERGKSAVVSEEVLDDLELALEVLMLRLRTRAGVSISEYRLRFGFDLEASREAWIERARDAGQLEPVRDRLILTTDGLAIADAAARELAPLRHEVHPR